MFAPRDTSQPPMRQGDVLTGLMLPRFKQDGHNRQISPKGELLGVFVETRQVTVVVLSQCCDINSKGSEVVTFAECPAQAKSSLRGASTSAIIEANTVPDGGGELGYHRWFALEPDGTVLREPHVVDLSRLYTVEFKELGQFSGMVQLRMDDATRALFKRKIAHFFMRPADS
jgi:hypothetical protein